MVVDIAMAFFISVLFTGTIAIAVGVIANCMIQDNAHILVNYTDKYDDYKEMRKDFADIFKYEPPALTAVTFVKIYHVFVSHSKWRPIKAIRIMQGRDAITGEEKDPTLVDPKLMEEVKIEKGVKYDCGGSTIQEKLGDYMRKNDQILDRLVKHNFGKYESWKLK